MRRAMAKMNNPAGVTSNPRPAHIENALIFGEQTVNSILKTVVCGVMAVAVMTSAATRQAWAQSAPQPSVVISMANMDRQLESVNYLVESAGFGQMGFLIKVQADQYLKGIDRSKPVGALLFFDDESPEPKVLGFVPVSNMDDILNTLADNVGGVEEGDDYMTLAMDSGEEILIKQAGDYAYLSDNAENFNLMPDDLAGQVGDLPQRYNLAFKVFGQRIPESLRDQALELIREGYEAQLDQMGDVDSLQSRLQQENFDLQMEQIKSFVNETDYLVIGMNAQKADEALSMELEFVGLEGSKLARQCAAAKDVGPSRFSGFLMEGAAFNFNGASKLLAEDADQYSGMIDQLKQEIINGVDEDGELSEAELEKVEGIVDNLLAAVNETLKAGKMDMGGCLMLNNSGANLAIGALMADPGKLEDAAKEAVAFLEAKGLGDEIQANLNSSTWNGINFHQILVPIPVDEEEARQMIGEQLEILLGIGKDTVYIAAGSNPMDLLKEAIEKSASASASGEQGITEYNLFLTPILRFAANIEGEEMMQMMADELATTGKDRISMTGQMVENGMKMRFEMQDGILKLINVAAQNMGGMMAPPGDDF